MLRGSQPLVYKIKLSIGSNHFPRPSRMVVTFFHLSQEHSVTQDILVVGIDTVTMIFLYLEASRGSTPSFFNNTNAIAGRLKSRCTMLIAKAHFHGFGLIGIRLFEKGRDGI